MVDWRDPTDEFAVANTDNPQGLYLAGTSLMNQPWGFDGYSALDTTLLDKHYGTIQVWRDAITEIHKRGMYVLFDNTIAT